MLDDAIAVVVPDIHTERKCDLVFVPAPLRDRGVAAHSRDDRPACRDREQTGNAPGGLATPFLRFLVRNCSNATGGQPDSVAWHIG